MGNFSPWGIPHGEFLRKSFAFHEFSLFSHAVNKLSNALIGSKTCTIHIFVLRPAILRTWFFFCTFLMGNYSPWGIRWGTFLRKSFAFHEFSLFSHAVKRKSNALIGSWIRTIHIFVLRPEILRTWFFFWWGIFPHGEFDGELFFTFYSHFMSFHSFHMR